MNFLDIFLVVLGALAGIWAYFSGSDSLYKLFLGLIIGFLMYLVVVGQIELAQHLSLVDQDSYQRFLSKHATGILSLLLLLIPVLGIIFMINSRLKIVTRSHSLSQMLLGLLLPIFLIGMLANLWNGSILTESAIWQKIFDFLSGSGLYRTFQKLPWTLFLLLAFLVFYKSLFLILYAFFSWLWRDVILEFFRSWNEEKNLQKGGLFSRKNDEIEE